MEPSFAPDTVNQHVQVGDKLWIGNPNQGWHERVKSPDQLANEQRNIFMEAVKPAVTSLESSIPEVQSNYQKRQEQVGAEKQPLKDRYDQLLNEIRGRETSQVNDTNRNVSREMGRRGIALSSTFAGDESLGRTAGIRGQAQSDILSTNFDRESKLREIDNTITNLNSEMVTSQRDIRNTIAQIQASAGTDAAKQAFQMFQIQQQERQATLDRVLKERELNANITNAQSTQATSAIKEVQGGLYNTQTNQWLVNPKATKSTGVADIKKYLSATVGGSGASSTGDSNSSFSNGGDGGWFEIK